MKVGRRYLRYIKQNPQHYWFRRKVWGWGWVPVTWEGWLTVVVFAVALLFIIEPFMSGPQPTDLSALLFAAQILSWVILLVLVCYIKGEPPKWQWGFPNEKK